MYKIVSVKFTADDHNKPVYSSCGNDTVDCNGMLTTIINESSRIRLKTFVE